MVVVEQAQALNASSESEAFRLDKHINRTSFLDTAQIIFEFAMTMMALVQPSASLSLSPFRDACVFTAPPKCTATVRFSPSGLVPVRASFIAGSPLLIRRSHERKLGSKAMPVSIRCVQSTQQGNSLDVWLGRLAMVGFASAITVEIATGKGLLENFGVNSPLPTVALAVTGLVGVLTAIFIFQSASKN